MLSAGTVTYLSYQYLQGSTFYRPMMAEAQPMKPSVDPYSRSRKGLKMERHEEAVIIGATGSSTELAKAVAKGLGLDIPAKTDTKHFADGETFVRVHDNVNGKHVYIV